MHVAAFFARNCENRCPKSMPSSGWIRCAKWERSCEPRSLQPSERSAAVRDRGYNFVTARPTYIPDYDTPRFRLDPGAQCLSEDCGGCNHPCSFCVIPQMRGRHRSRTPASVLAEIRALVAEGVKEINLISQDTTYYGMDLWDGEGRPAPAGRFFARADADRAAARDPDRSTAIFGCACSTRIRRIGATSSSRRSRNATRSRVTSTCRLQHIDEAMLGRMRRETSRAHIERSHRAPARRNSGRGIAHDFHRRISRRDRGGISKRCWISSSERASSGSAFSNTRRRKDRARRRCRSRFQRGSKTSVIAAP